MAVDSLDYARRRGEARRNSSLRVREELMVVRSRRSFVRCIVG
jgi:hypothetical protein